MMKKIVLAIVLVMALGFATNAQFNSDNFFMEWEDVNNGIDYNNRDGDIPGFPGNHGGGGDTPAPLGSGLIILSALGAGYAVARRKREE